MSTSAPPRIVLDTNLLIASIGSASPYRWLFDAFLDGAFMLCLSTPILLEYEEVLTRKTNAEVASNIVRLLLVSPHVMFVEPHFRWHLITADSDDDKFVDAALAAGAVAVVTHDQHFGMLADLDFPPLQVWSAAELQAVLAG